MTFKQRAEAYFTAKRERLQLTRAVLYCTPANLDNRQFL
jgi:hypothetical protein